MLFFSFFFNLEARAARKVTKRERGRAVRGSVEENGDEFMVIPTIHDSSIELANIDEWIKKMHRLGRPNWVDPIGKENRPESGRFPDRKDDDATSERRKSNLFPSGDQFPDRRTNEKTLVWPTDGERVGGGRSRESMTGIKTLTTSIRGRRKEIHRKTWWQKTGLQDGKRSVVDPPVVFIERTGAYIRGLNTRILSRKVKNVKVNRTFLAKQQSVNDVHLDERFWGTFFPKGDEVRWVRVPDHWRRRRDAISKQSLLEGQELSVTRRERNFFRR